MQNNGTLLRIVLLMTVIFVISAILYYLGLPSGLNVPFLLSVGYGILSNYSAILAIGLAVAIARENQGAAGLAAFLGYEVIFKARRPFKSQSTPGALLPLIRITTLVIWEPSFAAF